MIRKLLVLLSFAVVANTAQAQGFLNYRFNPVNQVEDVDYYSLCYSTEADKEKCIVVYPQDMHPSNDGLYSYSYRVRGLLEDTEYKCRIGVKLFSDGRTSFSPVKVVDTGQLGPKSIEEYEVDSVRTVNIYINK